MQSIAQADWESCRGVPEMVTLTYPADFPVDGKLVKQHFLRWLKRTERKQQRPLQCVWKLEYQRRGAPHFHVYLFRPVGPWRDWLDAAREDWFEVVGSGDPAHRQMGVRVDRQFASARRSARRLGYYFAGHAAKGAGHYQHDPGATSHPGRFWGIRNVERKRVEVRLDLQQYVEARRLLAQLARRRPARPVPGSKYGEQPAFGGRLRKRYRHYAFAGLWTLVDDPERVATQLLEAVGAGVDLTPLLGARAGPGARRREAVPGSGNRVGTARLVGC